MEQGNATLAVSHPPGQNTFMGNGSRPVSGVGPANVSATVTATSAGTRRLSVGVNISVNLHAIPPPPPPPAPGLPGAVTVSGIVPRAAVVQSARASNNPTRREWELARGAGSTAVVQSSTLNGTVWQLAGLLPGHLYRVRVRDGNANPTWGAWSGWVDFRTPTEERAFVDGQEMRDAFIDGTRVRELWFQGERIWTNVT